MKPFDSVASTGAAPAPPKPRRSCAALSAVSAVILSVVFAGYLVWRRRPPAVEQPEVQLGKLSHIPAFVLNLDRRADRLQNLSAAMHRQAPWLFELTCRVPAPNGRAFGDQLKVSLIPEWMWQAAVNRDKNRLPTVGGPLTKGGVALIIGHAIMWEHLLQTKAPWGILMEDDLMYFHPDLLALLQTLGDSAPEPGQDWDYLQMQGGDCPNPSPLPLRIRPGTGWNTGMYIITREAAKRAVQAHFPMTGGQLDNPENFLRSQCRGHDICPVPVMQTGIKDTDVQIPPEAAVFAAESLIPDCPPLNVGRMLLPDLMAPQVDAGGGPAVWG